MDFWFSYITLAEIYVLLGLSTNLLVGIVGIFSVSQAAVFGVGAYIVAYFLMAAEPMSFLPALGIAAVGCILFNHPLESTGQLTLLCTAGAGLGCLAFFLIMRAPFGRLLRAIREDESAV